MYGFSSPRHDDICHATQNRQDAVKQLAQQSDLVLAVGSPNSSNSNRLAELAQRMGAEAHLIDTADDIRAVWLDGKPAIGVTAGASAPGIPGPARGSGFFRTHVREHVTYVTNPAVSAWRSSHSFPVSRRSSARNCALTVRC